MGIIFHSFMKRTLASVANKLALKYAAEGSDYFQLADEVDGNLGVFRNDTSSDVQAIGHQLNAESIQVNVDAIKDVLHNIQASKGNVENINNFPGTRASEINRLMTDAYTALREVRRLLTYKSM